MDIEDLHLPCKKPSVLPITPHERRLRVLGHHVNGDGHDCSSCLQPCTVSAPMASGDLAAEGTTKATALELERAMKSTSWPIRNPYGGRMLDIGEIVSFHSELRSNRDLLPAELKRLGVDLDALPSGPFGRFLPSPGGDPSEHGPLSVLERLREKGELKEFVDANWPFQVQSGTRQHSASQHQEALDQFVANIHKGKPSMFAKPLVLSGHKTNVDRARFDAEVDTFASEVNIAGLSSELPQPNSFRLYDAFGKSMILTGDKDGKFHCFENSCRHRGAQLVTKQDPVGEKALFVCPYHSWSYSTDGALMNVPFREGFDSAQEVDIDNRNLIELPSWEQHGVLFVIPCPNPGVEVAHMEEIVGNSISADLMEELATLELDKLVCVVEQEMTIAANWKMGIDTFCETYHFSSLHPSLREVLVPGIQVFKTFGSSQEDARNARMTLGRFTTSLIANGEVSQEQLTQTNPLDHLIQVYHLAPNTVWNVAPGGIDGFQFWPGSVPGQSICTYKRYAASGQAKFMESHPQFKAIAVAQTTGIMQVVVCEDFDQMPRMQQNYAKNSVAETVYGRNEPCLQNRHKYYMRALRENGYGHVL